MDSFCDISAKVRDTSNKIILPMNSADKGQSILKCLFDVFNSHKKQTKTVRIEVP